MDSLLMSLGLITVCVYSWFVRRLRSGMPFDSIPGITQGRGDARPQGFINAFKNFSKNITIYNQCCDCLQNCIIIGVFSQRASLATTAANLRESNVTSEGYKNSSPRPSPCSSRLSCIKSNLSPSACSHLHVCHVSCSTN